MKNATINAHAADTFGGGWELQTFPTPGLTLGFEPEPSLPREFPAFLARAIPLPAAKAIGKISP
ncbi:MAG: hypothetical protein LBB26_03835 [Puniceicoccales bacterium]|nr:hypothetical protein [Puniceicoccales bacterium]